MRVSTSAWKSWKSLQFGYEVRLKSAQPIIFFPDFFCFFSLVEKEYPTFHSTAQYGPSTVADKLIFVLQV